MAGLGQILERGGIGRPLAGRGLLAAGQRHLAEQQFAELLGRADIHRFAGERMDFGFERARLWAKSPDSRARMARVDAMPRRSMATSTGTSGRSSVS